MKIALVLMSAIVFIYNLWKLQLVEDNSKDSRRNLRLFALSSVALIILALIR